MFIYAILYLMTFCWTLKTTENPGWQYHDFSNVGKYIFEAKQPCGHNSTINCFLWQFKWNMKVATLQNKRYMCTQRDIFERNSYTKFIRTITLLRNLLGICWIIWKQKHTHTNSIVFFYMYMKSIYLTSLQTKSIKQYNGINNNTIQFIITVVFHEFPKSEKLGATLQNTHGSATGSLENMLKKVWNRLRYSAKQLARWWTVLW